VLAFWRVQLITLVLSVADAGLIRFGLLDRIVDEFIFDICSAARLHSDTIVRHSALTL
jgi:hypothetical protein